MPRHAPGGAADSMKYALATINFGDFLCENVRASFLDAALRWNADFFELTEQNGVPGVLPFHQKFHLFDLCDADRIVYIDADAIIRQDAPSPFDLCPPGDFGAVEDETTDNPFAGDLVRNIQEDHSRINEKLGADCPYPDPYFNTGLMIMTRNAHNVFLKRCIELDKRINLNLTFWDQAVINYLIALEGIKTTALERAWNHTAPHIFGHWNGMEAYVYHFAGSGDRFTVLPRISWKQPPEPWQGLRELKFSVRQLRRPEEIGLEHGLLYYKQKEPAGEEAQLICYGPYFSMEPGRWEMRLDAQARAGFKAALLRRPFFQLSLTSRHGGNTHARFLIPGRFSPGKGYCFQFELKEAAADFEFVIYAFPGLRELTVRGVSLKRIGDASESRKVNRKRVTSQ